MAARTKEQAAVRVVKAPPKETALATPRVEEPWEAKLREQARADKAKFASGIQRITVDVDKKGNLTFKANDNELGQEIIFAALETAHSKQFYEAPYVKGQSATPDCYALGQSDVGLFAHPNSPHKQNLQPDGTSPCDGCQHNRFGTARVGKGKRCSDKPRLAVILAHDVEGKDEATLRKVGVYQLDIPAASIANFGGFLSTLPDLTPHGNYREALIRARCQMRPGAKGHELKFEYAGTVPPSAMPVILARGPAAYEQMTQPFPVLEQDGGAQEEAAPIKGQGQRQKGRR
jgi:hypothetical protein